MMKILVTGASGFIGSYVVEEALKRGFDTWAAVRKSSSREYLQDKRINFIELDFNSDEKLSEQLRGHSFDYIVHAAGLTKSLNSKDFYRVNTEGTKNLVNALLKLEMPVKKFVYLSSLSVCGPIREREPHLDILLSDDHHPNTYYGSSKLQAEDYLRSVRDRLNSVILRPTGVYGPREKDYFLMVKSIKKHIDIAVGFNRQDITFIYIADLVQAIFNSLNVERSGRAYFLTDGEVYESTTFSDCIREELGNPWRIRLTLPIWLLKTICSLSERWGKMTGKVPTLNNDKFNILSQRNWRCDVGSAMQELGFKPEVTLQEGVKRTVQWYKDSKWL